MYMYIICTTIFTNTHLLALLIKLACFNVGPSSDRKTSGTNKHVNKFEYLIVLQAS